MKTRRSVRQVIAGILKLQPHIDERERHSLIETGIRLGVAMVTHKPVHESYSGYGRLVSEQATGAQVQFLAPPPQIASYEVPEKHTDKMRPVHPTKKLLPLEDVIGPTATQDLPAVNPATGYYKPGHHPLLFRRLRLEREQGKR